MIDWQVLLAQVGSTTAIVSAIAWLARSLLAHGFTRDIETHKAELRSQVDTAIEHLRIHDHDRIEAFKRLYVFAKTVENVTYPQAEGRRQGFDCAMEDLYWTKLQLDQIYFPDSAAQVLEHFAEMYVCMRDGGLAEDTRNETDAFLKMEVFDQSRGLARLARAATAPLRGADQQAQATDLPS